MLVVPRRAFDLGLGAIGFNRPEGSGPFTREQMRFAGSVGGHLAVAVENARLVTELDASSAAWRSWSSRASTSPRASSRGP